jgi:hypothetical protein
VLTEASSSYSHNWQDSPEERTMTWSESLMNQLIIGMGEESTLLTQPTRDDNRVSA